MKLFITNRAFMAEDLSTGEGTAHKLAFKTLTEYINNDRCVPISMLVEGNFDSYYFQLVRLEMKDDLYMYEYVGKA